MVTIYMKIENVTGNVTTSGFEEQIRVDSVEFGAHRPRDESNNPAGALNLSKVKITKKVDTTSVLSLGSLANNAPSEIEINFTRSYDQKIGKFFILKLKQCFITDVTITTEEGGDPIETLLISYQENECIANDFDPEGRPLQGGFSQVLSIPRGR